MSQSPWCPGWVAEPTLWGSGLDTGQVGLRLGMGWG
jgi:hypothetical protein